MKKYYVSNNENPNTNWKSLIIADEKDIEEKIELACMARVRKADIDDIEEYSIEFEDSSESMTTTEAEDYIFLSIDELTDIESSYILNGYIDYSEDEEEPTEADEKAVIKSIIEKMKNQGETADLFETFKSWGYWDGSNWKEIILEHYYYDSQYNDYSEEFEDMKDIDFERYNTGDYTLYKLKDDSLILIDNSYYQGSLWSVYFINDSEIDTVEKANDYINREDAKLF